VPREEEQSHLQAEGTSTPGGTRVLKLPTADNPIVIIHADSRDVLPDLPENSISAILADPPFGIGFDYASHDDGSRHRDAGTPEGYGEWLWGILAAAERLCQPGSPVFVWQAMLNARHFAQWFPRDWRLFAAARNFVQMHQHATGMQNAFDPVVTWWTPGEPWRAKDGIVTRDYHIADTAPKSHRRRAVQWEHPCPRPLDQVRYLVRGWCRPGGIVLDCFGGSGTSAIAALKEGRRCIIIEKDPVYCDIIRRRVRECLDVGLFATCRDSQPALF
jgi:site-specific DNA-methyltransferase (adenine-specific)